MELFFTPFDGLLYYLPVIALFIIAVVCFKKALRIQKYENKVLRNIVLILLMGVLYKAPFFMMTVSVIVIIMHISTTGGNKRLNN